MSHPAARDFEFTHCSELERSTYVKWLPRERSANFRSKEPYDGRPLNQEQDGSRLTVRSGIAGPRSDYWKLSLAEEIIRLLDSSTLLGVHRSSVPPQYYANL